MHQSALKFKLPEFDYTEPELVSLESALSNSTWTSSTIKPEELQCTRQKSQDTLTHTIFIHSLLFAPF